MVQSNQASALNLSRYGIWHRTGQHYGPPYSNSQTILYGARSFSLHRLPDSIAGAEMSGLRRLG